MKNIKNKEELLEELLNSPKEVIKDFLKRKVDYSDVAIYMNYNRYYDIYYKQDSNIEFPEFLSKEGVIGKLSTLRGDYEFKDYFKKCIKSDGEYYLTDGKTFDGGWKEDSGESYIKHKKESSSSTFYGYNNGDRD